ncbi:MAG TPA: twin-arginine translocase TatA/TatE family subunit [Anaerolineae bacterium]
MMPFRIEFTDIILILLVALIVFGPKRLPEIGHSLGKAISEFRQGVREMTGSFREKATRPGTGAMSAPADTVYCSQCGVANVSAAKFCNKCGVRLAA